MQFVLPAPLSNRVITLFHLHVVLLVLHFVCLGRMLWGLGMILQIWACLDNFFCSLRLVLLEVLNKKTSKLGDLLLEAVTSLAPGVAWVQQFLWDTRAGLWYSKVERFIILKLDLSKLARVDSVKNSTSIFQSTNLLAFPQSLSVI